MSSEVEYRLAVAAERIGTGLLRLAAVEESRRDEDRPRDVSGTGLWLRPSQVDTVHLGRASQGGYDREVVKIEMRSGETFLVWLRYKTGFVGSGVPDETTEELLERVLRALGWRT